MSIPKYPEHLVECPQCGAAPYTDCRSDRDPEKTRHPHIMRTDAFDKKFYPEQPEPAPTRVPLVKQGWDFSEGQHCIVGALSIFDNITQRLSGNIFAPDLSGKAIKRIRQNNIDKPIPRKPK